MNRNSFFWPSYSDLMTSLFFIMLVLYIVTFTILKGREEAAKEEIEFINNARKNIEKITENKDLIFYDPEFKRYQLAFDIFYEEDGHQLTDKDIKGGKAEYDKTMDNIDKVANQLKVTLDTINMIRETDTNYRDVSYLVLITGYASDLKGDDTTHNYILSYKRAYYLYKYWKESLKIDFDNNAYHPFVEFIIAGLGTGGVGRYKHDLPDLIEERKNQRFLINIVPKFGEIKTGKDDKKNKSD